MSDLCLFDKSANILVQELPRSIRNIKYENQLSSITEHHKTLTMMSTSKSNIPIYLSPHYEGSICNKHPKTSKWTVRGLSASSTCELTSDQTICPIRRHVLTHTLTVRWQLWCSMQLWTQTFDHQMPKKPVLYTAHELHYCWKVNYIIFLVLALHHSKQGLYKNQRTLWDYMFSCTILCYFELFLRIWQRYTQCWNHWGVLGEATVMITL